MNTPQQRGGQAADVAWLLSDEALEIGRRAVEDELVELRDARIGQLRNNGLVIKERDGSPSDIIRLGPEDALRIGLRAMLTSAPPAPSVGGWMPIEEAPKEALWHDGDNHYGEYILVWYPGALRPLRARWWVYGDGKSCNFIADGGFAVFPTVFQPLPQPPKEKP